MRRNPGKVLVYRDEGADATVVTVVFADLHLHLEKMGPTMTLLDFAAEALMEEKAHVREVEREKKRAARRRERLAQHGLSLCEEAGRLSHVGGGELSEVDP